MLQPVSRLVSQAVNLSMDLSLDLFSAKRAATIYILTRSPCIKYMMIWIENNPFSLPRYI